ncbi:MAG: hypothetical protein PVH88_09275 [Ignavibacteria bacterium]|jgi:4-hydroxybenzoate polyprenyltransferase
MKVDKGSKVENINMTNYGDIINKVKKNNPWISGSFYLFVFVVVISAIAIVANLLPIYYLPVVIIGCLILMMIVMAFQLKNDEKLSDENFLRLMYISLKNIPYLIKK